jgi:Ca2+-binding RTX toxin-like protein
MLAAVKEATADLAASRAELKQAGAEKRAADLELSAATKALKAAIAAQDKPAEPAAPGETAIADAAKVAPEEVKAEILPAPEPSTLAGTEGADELWAAKSITDIAAGDGNDFIVSSAGGAKVDGGRGFDTVSYLDQGGEKGVLVDLAKGYAENTFGQVDNLANLERVIGSYGNDALYAALEGSVLEGHDGNDMLEGRDGKDLLMGGAGQDSLFGGAAQDTLVGGHGDDLIDGGEHDYDLVDYSLEGGTRAISVNMATGLVEDTYGTVDTLKNVGIVRGTAQADWMMGGAENMIFDGGAGNDTLIGGQGLNELYGAAGDDLIIGGDRTNYFEGGAGDDRMTAGSGFNVFAYYMADGTDTVSGFKETDVLRLYNSPTAVEQLLASASYHEAADGRDGLMFAYGDTKVFLAGVYELKAEQIQLVSI